MDKAAETNIVDDVLKLIEYVRISRVDANADNVKETLHDVYGSLCEMLQKIISAPINSRLFITAPVCYTPPEQQQASLEKHLIQAWSTR